jgi:hypothetical protein
MVPKVDDTDLMSDDDDADSTDAMEDSAAPKGKGKGKAQSKAGASGKRQLKDDDFDSDDSDDDGNSYGAARASSSASAHRLKDSTLARRQLKESTQARSEERALLPPPDLSTQKSLRAVICEALESPVVSKKQLRAMLLRAVRTSCPEAALTLLQRFPISPALREEAVALSDGVCQGWAHLVRELTIMMNRQKEDPNKYDVFIGGQMVNLRELKTRFEVEMMKHLPAVRLVPTPQHLERGFVPFALEDIVPPQCILHKQSLSETVKITIRGFKKLATSLRGIVDSNGVQIKTKTGVKVPLNFRSWLWH